MTQLRDSPSDSRRRDRTAWSWGGVALVLLIAATLFVVRGPMRALEGGRDFLVVYATSRAWLDGVNPYDYEALHQTLRKAGYTASAVPHPVSWPALYPPLTLMVFAPIAALPWSVALPLWVAINLLAVPLLVMATVRLAQLNWRMPAAWLLSAAILAMAPLHANLSMGQLALLPTLLVLGATLFLSHRRESIGAVPLALASAIKPHIGGVGLLLLFCRWRWRALSVAIVILVVIGAISLVPLLLISEPWRATLQSNLHGFLHGGAGDPTRSGPFGYQLINLHVPLHTLLDSRSLVNGIVLLLAAVAVGISWRLASRSRRESHDLLLLSSLAVVSLWAVTHRHYDAILLVIPLAWCFRQLVANNAVARGPAVAALVCMTAFLTPGGAMVHVLARRWHVPSELIDSGLWRMVIVSHQAWALLGLQGCLLLAHRREWRATVAPRDTMIRHDAKA